MSDDNELDSIFGRWVALQDETYWVPLKNIPSRIEATFEISSQEAGEVIAKGFRTGSISALDPKTGNSIGLERAMAENRLDWREGQLCYQGLPPISLVVHWPDVERAVRAEKSGTIIERQVAPATLELLAPRSKPSQAKPSQAKPSQTEVDAYMLHMYQTAFECGHPPPKRELEAFSRCSKDLHATDKQMRAAMQKLPKNLTRQRGSRDP